MKRCPKCNKNYSDETLNFCLDDGEWLRAGGGTDEPATAILASEAPTRAQVRTTGAEPRGKGRSLSVRQSLSAPRAAKPLVVTAAVVLAIVLAGVGYGVYRWAASQSRPAFQTVQLQRLTTSGKATDAAISPDGKSVAHVKREGGQESLWLRQVATASDTQIDPPSTQTYAAITFSKDGEYIYYRVGEPNLSSRTLYQVPKLGGAPRKVMENVGSPVSFSPDGTRLAFARTDVP